jgi:hypothetical protein
MLHNPIKDSTLYTYCRLFITPVIMPCDSQTPFLVVFDLKPVSCLDAVSSGLGSYARRAVEDA